MRRPAILFTLLGIGLTVPAAPALCDEIRCEAISALAESEERTSSVFRVSGLVHEGASASAIGLCGGAVKGVVWQVRAEETRAEGGREDHDLSLRHLYRRFDMDQSWSMTLGKAPRGVDVGYAAQPLDFLGEARDHRDVEDRLHQRKASTFAALDHASGNEAYGVVVGEYLQDRDSQVQVIITAETQIGGTHLLAVAQKAEDLDPGTGAGFSTVIGQSLELHGSAFFRQGTGRPIHKSLLDGQRTFYGVGEEPVAAWREQSGRWYSKWVVGGQWTALSGLNVIGEWLHDEAGLSSAQWSELMALADFHASGTALGVPPSAVTGNLRNDAKTLSASGSMQDYAFLRAAFPFEAVEAELRSLINLHDFSVSWGLRLTWPLGPSARLWLDAEANLGGAGTEFGEVPAARSTMLATSITF